jgi:hypothetical protein
MVCSQPARPCPSVGPTSRGRRIIVVLYALCALPGVLLLGAGPVLAQPAVSGSPSFQDRIDEAARGFLQTSPRLKGLTEQQRRDRVEFVVGNTLFVVLHEMGHVLISEMKLPVLGHEEDAADIYAALRMLRVGSSFSQRVLEEAAMGWFLSDRRDQEAGAKPLFYDEHSLSQQRAFYVVCLMVGSDPAKFKNLADGVKMPAERQETCTHDHAEARWSWDTVLLPHRRTPEQPEVKIEVVYGDGMGRFDVLAQTLRTVRLLDTVAAHAEEDFSWPAPLKLEMQTCGRSGAHWDDKARTLTICYELAFDFAELYRAYAGPPPPAAKRRLRSRARG